MTSTAWRSSTTRLLLAYGAIFVVWSIALIGAINWQTSRYLDGIVDRILEQRAHFLTSVDRAQLPQFLAATPALDLRGVMFFGLFDADGGYLAGNIAQMPPRLPLDGAVHPLPDGLSLLDGQHGSRTRGLALRLEEGQVMVLARDYSTVDRVGVLIRDGFFWALSLVLIPGLFGGYLLSRGPLRRVRGLEQAMQPIMRGQFSTRLPLSDRRDELDMLAAVVNTTLAHIEGLIGEVKGVSDSIAHDLRTPLTRLRAQLHRLQREHVDADRRAELIEHCIAEADSLLERFRALLRLSELEDRQRRAGFADIDLAGLLAQVHELYAPLADEKGIGFALEVAPTATLVADGTLLFEAVSNLVSNAIKFTPQSGRVVLRGVSGADGPAIEVQDSGPGIPPEERQAVLQRFYRTQLGMQQAGFGLGLCTAAAIVRLHGFRLEIASADPGGARVVIHCKPVLDEGTAGS